MPVYISIDPQASSSALPRLLTHYMMGRIADTTWHQLMSLFDADAVSSQERLALARFVNDLLDDPGPKTFAIPRLDEAQELLTETRMAFA